MTGVQMYSNDFVQQLLCELVNDPVYCICFECQTPISRSVSEYSSPSRCIFGTREYFIDECTLFGKKFSDFLRLFQFYRTNYRNDSIL